MVARANAHVTYPAQFQLVAAMNPCRCGYLGDPALECTKAPRCGIDYQAKLSGPLLDRIDLQVEVGAVSIQDLSEGVAGEPSKNVAARVAAARAVQEERYAPFADQGILTNAQATPDMLESLSPLSEPARTLLQDAAARMSLSARAYHRLIKVARTIADLDHRVSDISPSHIAEALSYRRLKGV